jgi:sporulation protein YlmC with PRC-barrel domain
MNDYLLMVTEIMGKKVRTKDGEEVGVVQNIMINPKNKMIIYIILCYADFVGRMHRHFVIPNEMVMLNGTSSKDFYLEIEREQLSEAYSLDIDDEPPFYKESQRIYEIDQDSSEFSYINFL